MRVAMFSERERPRGWFRAGDDIRYIRSTAKHSSSSSQRDYHVLSFSYTFAHDDDVVSMAFAEPYTVSDLRHDVCALETLANARPNVSFRRETICTSIGGCECELLTLTSARGVVPPEGKRAVVLTARVHPGETVGSWMMKGVMEFLLSGEREAEELLEKYVFKVVPCLNPDGVVQGNYRCSLAGCDLNRRYPFPSKVRYASLICVL